MKSAKTLGITPLERRYLIKAEKILAKLLPKQKVNIPGDGKYMFYMPQVMIPIDLDVWKKGEKKEGKIPGTYECGTAGCIAGLMHILGHANGEPVWGDCLYHIPESRVLTSLFYPVGVSLGSVTPKQAARAIRYFLDTGDSENAFTPKRKRA